MSRIGIYNSPLKSIFKTLLCNHKYLFARTIYSNDKNMYVIFYRCDKCSKIDDYYER